MYSGFTVPSAVDSACRVNISVNKMEAVLRGCIEVVTTRTYSSNFKLKTWESFCLFVLMHTVQCTFNHLHCIQYVLPCTIYTVQPDLHYTTDCTLYTVDGKTKKCFLILANLHLYNINCTIVQRRIFEEISD